MDRPGDEPALLEAILGAAKRVVVLRGPAASGKTEASLAFYREHLDDVGRCSCVLVAPNAPAVADLRRRLLARSISGVVVSPRVVTFASLAAKILAAAGHATRILPAFRRHLLLRRIVDERSAAGQLKVFGAVADTPGFVVSLDRSLAELKRAAVEPEQLARTVGREDAKGRELVDIYRAYQQEMRQAGWYDVEGRMWQAREVLAAAEKDAPPPGLEGVTALVVDGFTDFTPTQLAMLKLLSVRLGRVVVTLPFVDDGRTRLWQWTHRTLGHIRRTFGQDLEEIVASDTPSPLRPLWDGVFEPEATAVEPPERLWVIAAAGAESEVAAVARRVKRLLLEGAPAGSIAVLARSLDAYRPLIERVFASHDIPLAPAPAALTDVPIVRFLLHAAGLAPEFAFRDVMRTVASSYFLPAALGNYGPQHVAAAQMLIRDGNVMSERASYRRAAELLTRRGPAEGEDEEIELGAIRASPDLLRETLEMLESLFDLAEAADCPAGLSRLIEGLDLPAAALRSGLPSLVARDLRALAVLGACLADLPDPPPDRRHLSEALATAACPPERQERLVDVLDVLDARSLRWRHVFLLGLSEGQFPRKFSEPSIVTQADRAAWRRGGVELDTRDDVTAREMLLFYLAASRAEESLTLSYLESDATGQASAPSTFLLSLLDVVGGRQRVSDAGRIEGIPAGSFVPPEGEIASPRDAFNAAVAGLFDAAAASPPATLAWAAARETETLHRAARGLYARYQRYLPGECSRFDGRITDAGLLAELAGRFPGRAVFSAGRLNAYGQCPWQFFAHSVLRLEPLPEPQRRLEPVARGLFVHGVLFRVMSGLRDEAGGAFRLADVDDRKLLRLVDEAVSQESRRVEAAGPPYPGLWRIQKEQIRLEIANYLLARRSDEPATEHAHFELGFGVEGLSADLLDPESTAEPIRMDTPAGPVRIAGKIDRVDRIEFDSERGLFVVDYKTGRLPSASDIDAGRNLQLPIYTEAAGRLLGQTCLGGAFHQIGEKAERHFSAVKPPRNDARPFAERRAAAVETIGRFVRGMAAGVFDVLPTHDCPRYCPFRQICQYSPARARLKEPAAKGAGDD